MSLCHLCHSSVLDKVLTFSYKGQEWELYYHLYQFIIYCCLTWLIDKYSLITDVWFLKKKIEGKNKLEPASDCAVQLKIVSTMTHSPPSLQQQQHFLNYSWSVKLWHDWLLETFPADYKAKWLAAALYIHDVVSIRLGDLWLTSSPTEHEPQVETHPSPGPAIQDFSINSSHSSQTHWEAMLYEPKYS